MNGLLSEENLVELGRIKLGIYKIEKMIAHLNALTLATGLPLRHVEKYQFALLENDICILAKAHELAEQKIRESAMAILEKNIASGVSNFDFKQTDNRFGKFGHKGDRKIGQINGQAKNK